jgi:TolB-like protein
MGKKMMILGLAILMLSIGGFVFAQAVVTLDQAISHGVSENETRLAQGSKVVVLNFRSSSQSLSNYVLDEMTAGLERGGKLRVAEKADIEFILRELNYQRSGNISDESAQSIGRILGAQYVISGAIEESGSNYVIEFKTITVEPVALQTITRVSVIRDAQIVDLMGAAASNTARARADASNSEAETSSVTRPRAEPSSLPGAGASNAEDDTSNLDKTIVLSAGGGVFGDMQMLINYKGPNNLEPTLAFGAPLFVNADLFKYLSVNLSLYYNNSPMSDSQSGAASFSVFGKIPVQLFDGFTLSPFLGVGYNLAILSKVKGSKLFMRKDSSGDFLSTKPGVGLDYNLTGDLWLNASFIFDVLLYRKNISIKDVLWLTPNMFIGVSYTFLRI